MISVFDIKTIADLVIQLFSERQKNREQLITEVIDPLYDKTKIIVESYRQLLARAVRAAKSSSDTEFEACICDLKRIRDSYITERQSVTAHAKVAIDKWRDEDLKEFSNFILYVFFSDADGPLFGGAMSLGPNVLGHLEDFSEGKIDRHELLQLLGIMEQGLNFNWDRLSMAYAEIKLPDQ